MALYDRYSNVMSRHPPLVQRAERYRQNRLLDIVGRHLRKNHQAIRALEVGVGIGLFAQACRERGWNYTGVDRNEKMVTMLGKQFHVILAEVPPLPANIEEEIYDLAYTAFVLEHLRDGSEAFLFVNELARAVRTQGLIVLVVPDALSLGLEFWNLDYTHRYPTAERNVTQILLESRLEVEEIVRYRGPCLTGPMYWVTRFAGCLYSYRLWAVLTGNKALPYSIYQYLNQDVLVFICRKPEIGSTPTS